jgi:hypothetical protein
VIYLRWLNLAINKISKEFFKKKFNIFLATYANPYVLVCEKKSRYNNFLNNKLGAQWGERGWV